MTWRFLNTLVVKHNCLFHLARFAASVVEVLLGFYLAFFRVTNGCILASAASFLICLDSFGSLCSTRFTSWSSRLLIPHIDFIPKDCRVLCANRLRGTTHISL